MVLSTTSTSRMRELSRSLFCFPLITNSYDKVIIAVGSSSSTHGVPGLENCFQLKTISDAQAMRRRILGIYLFLLTPLY